MLKTLQTKKSECDKCAQKTRLHSCKGDIKDCRKFIDYRANCRRCKFVSACQRLGKDTGIYHVCVNFERGKPPFPDLSSFHDYDKYLAKKKAQEEKPEVPTGVTTFIKKPKTREQKDHEERLVAGDEAVERLDFDPEKQPDDWSPELLVGKIISSGYDPRVFNLIDDGDIVKPDNPVRFMIEPQFMNISLFPRQLQIGLEYFAAYCPWCSDQQFIRSIEVDTSTDDIIDHSVLYSKGVCPKCGKTRYDAIKAGLLGNYSTFVGLCGQRSGKSVTHGIFAAAVLAQYLCLPNPVTFMKQLESVTFRMTFVGLRYADAYENLWQDFYNNITNSPWYKKYNQFLTEQGILLGKELFRIKDSYAIYTMKGLGAVPSGPDRRKLRGRCVTGDTLITTNKGLVPCANIGAYLYNDDILTVRVGKFDNHIVEFHPQGRKHVVRLVIDNKTHLDVSFDHRIPVFMPESKSTQLVEARYCYGHYVTYQLGDEYCKQFFDNYGKNILNDDTGLALITDVIDLGKKEVFDIGIDSKDHLFPANGILVHNTRFWSSMDEVGHFTGRDGNMTLDPDEVFIALDNSLATLRVSSNKLLPRYPDVPTAHSFNISSPRAKLDKIMRLYKQSKIVPSYYGIRYPTWEFNPNITRKDLNDKFLADPIGAERDFGANPPFGVDLYIPNPADVVSIISNKKNALNLKRYHTAEDSLGGKVLYPTISMRPHKGISILAIDCGLKNNSFALALMHKRVININEEQDDDAEEFDEDDDRSISTKTITACSGILEIQPHNGMSLSFPLIYEHVIKKILTTFDVRVVAFDRWQSINLSQQIYNDFGIDALQFSVTMSDFDDLKEKILSDEFVIPRLEQDLSDIISLDKDLNSLVQSKPVSHFIIQLLTSKNNGRIIDKGDETTDDILRAIVLGNSILWNEDYAELFTPTDDDDDSEGQIVTGSIGVAVGNGGDVLNGSSGGGNGNSTFTVIPKVGVSLSFQ